MGIRRNEAQYQRPSHPLRLGPADGRDLGFRVGHVAGRGDTRSRSAVPAAQPSAQARTARRTRSRLPCRACGGRGGTRSRSAAPAAQPSAQARTGRRTRSRLPCGACGGRGGTRSRSAVPAAQPSAQARTGRRARSRFSCGVCGGRGDTRSRSAAPAAQPSRQARQRRLRNTLRFCGRCCDPGNPRGRAGQRCDPVRLGSGGCAIRSDSVGGVAIRAIRGGGAGQRCDPGASGGWAGPAIVIETLAGSITSVGFSSGHRFVVGHWPESPIGAFADIMWARPDGSRALLAAEKAAAFVTSVYPFDEVEVQKVLVAVEERRLTVRARDLRLSLALGRLVVPFPPPAPAWSPARSRTCAPTPSSGPGPRGVSPTGVSEWYRTRSLRWVSEASASLHGESLGPMGTVRRPLGFGFTDPPPAALPGRPPSRPRPPPPTLTARPPPAVLVVTFNASAGHAPGGRRPGQSRPFSSLPSTHPRATHPAADGPARADHLGGQRWCSGAGGWCVRRPGRRCRPPTSTLVFGCGRVVCASKPTSSTHVNAGGAGTSRWCGPPTCSRRSGRPGAGGRGRPAPRAGWRSPVWDPPRSLRTASVRRMLRCSRAVSFGSSEPASRTGDSPARHSASSTSRLPSPGHPPLVQQPGLQRHRRTPERLAQLAQGQRQRVRPEPALVGVELHPAQPPRVAQHHRTPRPRTPARTGPKPARGGGCRTADGRWAWPRPPRSCRSSRTAAPAAARRCPRPPACRCAAPSRPAPRSAPAAARQ